MTSAIQDLLAEALRLPEDARADLAAAIVESLDDTTDGPAEVEASWSAEIQQRVADLESGLVKPVAWKDARRTIFGPADEPADR